MDFQIFDFNYYKRRILKHIRKIVFFTVTLISAFALYEIVNLIQKNITNKSRDLYLRSIEDIKLFPDKSKRNLLEIAKENNCWGLLAKLHTYGHDETQTNFEKIKKYNSHIANIFLWKNHYERLLNKNIDINNDTLYDTDIVIRQDILSLQAILQSDAKKYNKEIQKLKLISLFMPKYHNTLRAIYRFGAVKNVPSYGASNEI